MVRQDDAERNILWRAAKTRPAPTLVQISLRRYGLFRECPFNRRRFRHSAFSSLFIIAFAATPVTYDGLIEPHTAE